MFPSNFTPHVILCHEKYRPAHDLLADLLNQPASKPAIQRCDALETACTKLAAKLGMNHTLAELEYLCECFNLLTTNAGLADFPAVSALQLYGNTTALAVYELELSYTKRESIGTLGQRIARIIAELISSEEYRTTTEEHNDYCTKIIFNH